ncbi:15565_t:CDS:2, partial [Funneliformis geosporum]
MLRDARITHFMCLDLSVAYQIFIGNILISNKDIRIGDLGLSKSATEAGVNETYGIIPYMAPEVLQGQKYTKASDIYSYGMIMWEYMTGRKPFWDRAHDTELIIDICDGLRPPTVDIVAPKGYIELIKVCWDSDPSKRPTAKSIRNDYSNEDVLELKVDEMRLKLAFLKANPNASIEKTLDGEELNANKIIVLECF